MHKFLIFKFVLIFFSQFTYAQSTVNWFDQSTGLNRLTNQRYLVKRQGPVRELARGNLTADQQRVADQAAQLAGHSSLLSIVLVERGKIIYEHYNYPARADRWQMSWSMSKSLTAYTLGTAMCKGQFTNLDQPAAALSPELKGTVYAEATVRDILKMSSGTPRAVYAGEAVKGGWDRMLWQVWTGQDYVKEYGVRDKGFFGPVKSGNSFSYLGIDTLALESVVEAQGGFLRQFEENIWSKIGAERGSSWLLDKNGRAIAQSGFTAHTRDWARLAMWTIDQIKGDDACMRDFMKAATSHQISNYSSIAPYYKGYGYQTWIGNFGPRPSYWWIGYGGQRVGVDPETERIIVVFSHREDYMDQIHNLFGAWQRN
jgi:CubicO group peptidase (beta-lactamase class C family)